MKSKSKVYFIGNPEAEPYGVVFEYKYKDIFKMNRFLWYLIQNQDSIIEKLEVDFNSDIASKFESKISIFDEYEVAFFHNLDTVSIESKYIEYNIRDQGESIILSDKQFEIIILKENYENIKKQISDENDFDIEIEDLPKYNEATVTLSIVNLDDIPLLFMTEEQIELNLNYLTETLNEILEDLKLNAQASEMELKNIFKIHN